MVKTKLQKIGIISVAKFSGIYGLIVGLIAGIFIAAISMIGTTGPDLGALGFVFGFGAIIALPIFYGISGFIGGIISAFLFNIIAKMAGGIEMHFKELE